MKRPALLVSILILLVLALSVIRTVVANRITTKGVMLGEIEDKISYYKTENLIYEEKIYNLSSLTNISAKASKIGFVETNNTVAITSSIPIAAKQ